MKELDELMKELKTDLKRLRILKQTTKKMVKHLKGGKQMNYDKIHDELVNDGYSHTEAKLIIDKMKSRNHIPRKPVSNAKIIVDDLETKIKIMEISEQTGESMKAIIQRLVDIEHNVNKYYYKKDK